jgi:hypothetical protein
MTIKTTTTASTARAPDAEPDPAGNKRNEQIDEFNCR